MADQSKDSVQVKKCKKCGVEQLMAEFYMSCSSKHGHMGQCVFCLKGKTRAQKDEEYRLAVEDMAKRRARYAHKTKVCNACGVDKPWSDFRVARKSGPYGMYDYATGRCCQCQKIRDEYMKTRPRTTVDIGNMRFLVDDENKPATEIAFAQFRSKQVKERFGFK
jgi:hypothetical protein